MFSNKWYDADSTLNETIASIEKLQKMLDILKRVYLPYFNENTVTMRVLKAFAGAFKFNGEIILLSSERELLRKKFVELKSLMSGLHNIQNGREEQKLINTSAGTEENQGQIEKLLSALIISLGEQGFEFAKNF